MSLIFITGIAVYDFSVTLLPLNGGVGVVVVVVIKIVSIFFSSYLNSIEFGSSVDPHATGQIESESERALNAGLIYEIALLLLYAVIWVVNVLCYSISNKCGENNIQFCFSSFSIHWSNGVAFFRRPFTKFLAWWMWNMRDICETREVNYRKWATKRMLDNDETPRKNGVTHISRSVDCCRFDIKNVHTINRRKW